MISFQNPPSPLFQRGYQCLLAGIIAAGLKAHYSTATAGDLSWILAPTAAVVGWLRGEQLTYEAGIGWVPADHRYVIAPACAGVNFMIVAFVTLVFAKAQRMRGGIIAALAGAYGLTIAVNALRIIVAVALYDGDVHAGWLTAERVHRVAGTVIYLAALSAIVLRTPMEGHASACPFSASALPGYWQPRRSAALHVGGMIVPLAYVAVTVGIPLLNGAWREFGWRFAEHALTVSGLAVMCGLLLSTMASATSSATGSGTRGSGDEQSDDLGGRRRAGNR